MQKINYWIKASRPQTLIASFAPVFSASILCYKNYGKFSFIIFFLTTLSAILIQIITNFINDLYDYKKGSDNSTRLGPERMIQKGYLKESEIIRAVIILLILAIFSGLYLVLVGGWIILSIGLSAFVLAYLYTATRLSIAYNGLGEIFVFLYFGLIASLGTFYLQTGFYNYDAFLIGVIFGFLNMALLIINNLRDYNEDLASNKKTLIVLLGVDFGKLELFVSLFSPFIVSYYLAMNMNQNSIFNNLLPVILLPIVIFCFLNKNKKFITEKALPLTSIYILLFTAFLTFNL